MTDTLTRQLAGALAELRAATVRTEDDPDIDAAKGPADMALALWATRYQPGEPRPGVTSIVPAFFVVEADPERADDAAAAAAMFLNDCVNVEDLPAGAAARLFLCEASPTTEWSEGAVPPRTLEGLTCDSGSDRSAAGLIRAIADCAHAVEGATPAELTASVVAAFGRIQQLSEGWLRQRMALHPTAPSIQPAEGAGQQDAVDLLLHAWAKADRTKDPDVAAEALEAAFLQAKAERPGAYEAIVAMHQQLEDDGCPKGDPDCLGNNGDCHDACEPPAGGQS